MRSQRRLLMEHGPAEGDCVVGFGYARWFTRRGWFVNDEAGDSWWVGSHGVSLAQLGPGLGAWLSG